MKFIIHLKKPIATTIRDSVENKALDNQALSLLFLRFTARAWRNASCISRAITLSAIQHHRTVRWDSRRESVSEEFACPIPIGVYDRNENGHPDVSVFPREWEPTLWRGADIHLPVVCILFARNRLLSESTKSSPPPPLHPRPHSIVRRRCQRTLIGLDSWVPIDRIVSMERSEASREQLRNITCIYREIV